MRLGELIHTLCRHRGKMAVSFVAVLLATGLVTLLSPRAYQAHAKLLVRLGRENATLDPTVTLGQAQVVSVQHSRENELNAAIEILKSRVLLDQVVDALGPSAILNGRVEPAPEPADAATPEAADLRYRAGTKLAKSLDVEPVKRSNVLAISYAGATPELAQAVVAKLLDFYLERHIQLSRTPGAQRFLEEQTARRRAQLGRVEEELRDLKTATGLVAPDGQRVLIVNRLGRLEDELLQTTSALAAAEAEVRQLREKCASLPPTQVTGRTKGVRNEATDNMRAQLYSLQLRELELRQKLPEGHTDLKRISREVADARELLRQEEQSREQVTEGPNRAYEELQLSLLRQEPILTSLRTKAATLRTQLEQQRAALQALNENVLRVARLEREVNLQESHYRRYADNLGQAQADHALEAERISNISIVQPATCDPKPIRPRMLVNFGLGLLLAMAVSIGLAIGAERLDPSVKSAAEVEGPLGLRVLATVPHLEGLVSDDWAVCYEVRNDFWPKPPEQNGAEVPARLDRLVASNGRNGSNGRPDRRGLKRNLGPRSTYTVPATTNLRKSR